MEADCIVLEIHNSQPILLTTIFSLGDYKFKFGFVEAKVNFYWLIPAFRFARKTKESSH